MAKISGEQQLKQELSWNSVLGYDIRQGIIRTRSHMRSSFPQILDGIPQRYESG